jgi:2',3'-cyclic-nucleotide 2'-phosphodiesterase (5'-nucleotidase family)
MATVTIFHTGDMHNRLTPEKAQRLRELKSSAENALLLDAGDAIWAGNVLYRPGGEPILKLMNLANYDAMAMGNREFHFTRRGFRAKVTCAEFPVLCANVHGTGGETLPVVPHTIFERGGIRVAVFGLCLPMITERTIGKRFSVYRFSDPIETAAEIVPQLRRQADCVIALTHIGIDRDRRLAKQVGGIDLIVGGHTHTEVMEPGGAPIVHSGWAARTVGKAVLAIPGGLESWETLDLAVDEHR